MNWSFRVARVAGTDIKVHVSFVLILLLGALQWSGRNSPSIGRGRNDMGARDECYGDGERYM